MISLAVWILVTKIISYNIAVSHHKIVTWELLIIIDFILDIHSLIVLTKPARWISSWFLIKFSLDFFQTGELFITANSCITFTSLFCISTEHHIPVLCDVEISIIDVYIYLNCWHCSIDWHSESGIFIIINLAKIQSLVKLLEGQHWPNHQEEKHYNCRVSNQWTTTSYCSLVLAIPAVVDLIRRLGACRIEVSEEWAIFCLLWHLCILI